MCDSGDYWGNPKNAYVTNDLGMLPLLSDSTLYIKFDDSKLIGLSGIQVDESLNTGTDTFEKLTELTLEKFDPKPQVYG